MSTPPSSADGSPFAAPNYGEGAHEPIASKPTWSLEQTQSSLTGWIGVAVAVGAALCLPWIGARVGAAGDATGGFLETALRTVWTFRGGTVLLALFAAMLLVEVVVFKVHRRHFDFNRARPVDAAAWRRIGERWLAVLGVLGVAAGLYLILHEYRFIYGPDSEDWTFGRFRTFFAVAAPAVAVLCVPYFWLVERHARAGGPVDEFLVLARIARAALTDRTRAGEALRNPHVRNVLLGCAVKFFFVPLVLTWTLDYWDGWIDVAAGFSAHATPDSATGLQVIALSLRSWHIAGLYLLIMLEVTLGTLGYLASARLLDTHITSAEPTLIGWVAALACYPPFKHVTSEYLSTPAEYTLAEDLFMRMPLLSIAFSLVVLATFFVYAWATYSFGLRFSNLTNRGIICAGPYRVVRHPAYAAKTLAWWLVMIPGALAYPPAFILAFIVRQALFTGVYVLRAWTEERHLMREPHYREYCEKVQWRFVPGVW